MAVSGSAGSEPGLSSPRLLPVPSAWWETPAVTSRVLAAQPESASTARHFTREVLVSWGFGGLADEAETIIGELVVNAVQHGTRGTTGQGWRASATHERGPNGDPRARARAAWTGHLNGARYDDAGHPDPAGSRGSAGDTGSAAGAARPAAGGAVLRLCLLRRAGEIMLAVIDASDDAPTPRQTDWDGESGRGLQIVDALSSVWGWSPIEGHGKAVWAVLPQALAGLTPGTKIPNGTGNGRYRTGLGRTVRPYGGRPGKRTGIPGRRFCGPGTFCRPGTFTRARPPRASRGFPPPS